MRFSHVPALPSLSTPCKPCTPCKRLNLHPRVLHPRWIHSKLDPKFGCSASASAFHSQMLVLLPGPHSSPRVAASFVHAVGLPSPQRGFSRSWSRWLLRPNGGLDTLAALEAKSLETAGKRDERRSATEAYASMQAVRAPRAPRPSAAGGKQASHTRAPRRALPTLNTRAGAHVRCPDIISCALVIAGACALALASPRVRAGTLCAAAAARHCSSDTVLLLCVVGNGRSCCVCWGVSRRGRRTAWRPTCCGVRGRGGRKKERCLARARSILALGPTAHMQL